MAEAATLDRSTDREHDVDLLVREEVDDVGLLRPGAFLVIGLLAGTHTVEHVERRAGHGLRGRKKNLDLDGAAHGRRLHPHRCAAVGQHVHTIDPCRRQRQGLSCDSGSHTAAIGTAGTGERLRPGETRPQQRHCQSSSRYCQHSAVHQIAHPPPAHPHEAQH